MVHNLLNESTSKQATAFSKSARFPPLYTLTANVAASTYDKKSDADNIVNKGKGKSKHDFGSKH